MASKFHSGHGKTAQQCENQGIFFTFANSLRMRHPPSKLHFPNLCVEDSLQLNSVLLRQDPTHSRRVVNDLKKVHFCCCALICKLG